MKVERQDLCEMPHKVLINPLLCSHTVSAQIRAQQASSNDLDQDSHMAATATHKIHILRMCADTRTRMNSDAWKRFFFYRQLSVALLPFALSASSHPCLLSSVSSLWLYRSHKHCLVNAL